MLKTFRENWFSWKQSFAGDVGRLFLIYLCDFSVAVCWTTVNQCWGLEQKFVFYCKVLFHFNGCQMRFSPWYLWIPSVTLMTSFSRNRNIRRVLSELPTDVPQTCVSVTFDPEVSWWFGICCREVHASSHILPAVEEDQYVSSSLLLNLNILTKQNHQNLAKRKWNKRFYAESIILTPDACSASPFSFQVAWTSPSEISVSNLAVSVSMISTLYSGRTTLISRPAVV